MKVHMSWESYIKKLEKIIENLLLESFTPDIVIGIARGGMVPATMLAHHYKTRNLGIVYIQKTKSDNAFSEMLPVPVIKGFFCPEPLHGKRVLIIDCIVQTGQTMKCALDLVSNQNPNKLLLASVCTHSNVPSLNYFSPATVKDDDWVFFPWEISK